MPTVDLSRGSGQPHSATPSRGEIGRCSICGETIVPSRVPGLFYHVDADGRPAASRDPKKRR